MKFLNNLWYRPNYLANFLRPLSWGYRAAVALRRSSYRWGIQKTTHFPVPIIVVGNITVGGTGKTPLVISLAHWLKQAGWRPGLVSRGYGGDANRHPQSVFQNSDPRQVGDEAVLLAQKTGCPLIVCRDRVAAVATLLQEHDCNIVISDDGLQHLALGRNVEIAVLDGERRLGNGLCLPAGPLREPAKRLRSVDFIVSNGEACAGEWQMTLIPGEIYQLTNPLQRLALSELSSKTVHAVAAIGNPQRFFKTLESAGLVVIPHPFPDHHFFQKQDLDFGDDAIIIMTEKDAVKCRAFANDRFWCLPINAELPAEFFAELRLSL